MLCRGLTRIAIPTLLALVLAGIARADEEWVEVRSPNFSVITNAGEKRGREVAQRFEQMRYIFGTLIHRAKINLPAPLQIIGFRNSKGFREFAPLWKGKPVRAAGLFLGGEDRNYILLDMSSLDPLAAVYHEYGHLLLNGNYPLAQAWFDEGFAEYFRSIKIMGKRAQVGGVPEGNWDVLGSARFFPSPICSALARTPRSTTKMATIAACSTLSPGWWFTIYSIKARWSKADFTFIC
jgi:hypothetical protein